MNITDLKNTTNIKTLNLILLSCLTGGVFLLYWLWRNQPKLNEILGEKVVGDKYLIGMAACYFWSSVASGTENVLLILFSLCFTIASAVLYIMWAFKMRKALQHYAVTKFHFKLNMNAFYTFFFTIFYVNYCINDFETAHKEHVAFNTGANPQPQPQPEQQPEQQTEQQPNQQ